MQSEGENSTNQTVQSACYTFFKFNFFILFHNVLLIYICGVMCIVFAIVKYIPILLYIFIRFSSLLMSLLTLCAILSGQPMFKTTLISLISSSKSNEIEEGETIDASSNGTTPSETTYHRFIPLLLFLVQKLETSLPVKLCVMVSPI